ncbi:MAG: hypothetical protein ACOYXT_22785 [Bacteroidota bacterium]
MKAVRFVLLGILISMLASCHDEKMGSIIGKWNGSKAEFDLKPFRFPYSVNRTGTFDSGLEFRNDGTLTLIVNGQPVNGTYEVKDNQLISSTIHFDTDIIAMSGIYTIKELTDARLVIFSERDDTFQDPDTGTNLRGTVKATFYFDRGSR